MKGILSHIESFVHLIYPHLCYGCGETLLKTDRLICMHCRSNLPFTNFINEPDNPVSRRFYGKVMLREAFAFLIFNKGAVVQKLIHKLKYENKPEIGTLLGEILGNYINEQPVPKHWDVVTPVPLHPKKEKQRGYNQAAIFAEALAGKIGAQYQPQLLTRTQNTQSQTNKSRIERNTNVSNIFVANTDLENEIAGKSILLVDDVVTTGATCEYCLIELQKLNPKYMSVAAIATAL